MIDKLPRIAVLMAAYNGMAFIKEQLHSIESQKNVDVSIFISVDVSTDGTYEWCCEYARQYECVTVLFYGEKFGGAAPNFYRLIKDVAFESYDYIAFSDQDDIWALDKLSHGIRQMELARAEAYSASVIAFWEDGREKLLDKSQPQKEFDYLLEAAGPGCTYIFTKKAAFLIKKYLNSYSELNEFVLHDWLSYAIVRHNQYGWFIDSEPKMWYRQHGANQVGANSSVRGMVYRVRYVLSKQVFSCMAILISTLGISSIQLSSRIGILRFAFKAKQLRRRTVDQVFVFVALLFHAIKGSKV